MEKENGFQNLVSKQKCHIYCRVKVEIRDVADILRHSKIEATENYYISSTEETLKEASEKFEENVKIRNYKI